MGPDAAIMTILAAALVAVAADAPSVDRTAVAAILALGVGAFVTAAWVLRLGVLASFLSRPILIGFFTGISLSILIGQIKRVTGVDIEADGLIRPVVELLQNRGNSALVGAGAGHVRLAAACSDRAFLQCPDPLSSSSFPWCFPRFLTLKDAASRSSATYRRNYPR